MIQVKIFKENSIKDLENRVNNFLDSKLGIVKNESTCETFQREFQDIKYIDNNSAMIIYEELRMR